MSSTYLPLSLNLLPSTNSLDQAFSMLFEATGLSKNRGSRLSSQEIETRKLALRLIVCCLLKETKMVSERFCSRTIEPNSFTGIGFSRFVFDAVIQRLEQHQYVRFERGVKTPQQGFLSRVYIKLKLIKFFQKHGITKDNLKDNLKRYVPRDLVGKSYVEVRAGSYRPSFAGIKFKGKKVSNHRFREHKKFIEQMNRLEELNEFLFQFDLKLPDGGSFNGLRRIFANYTGEGYTFVEGGRLYGQYEGDYQRLSKKQRTQITINGQAVVEVDIHGSFLTIAHYLRGIAFPATNDLYRIEGVHRDIAKSWINLTLTDSKPRTKWPTDTKKGLLKDGHNLKPASHYAEPILKQYPFLASMDARKHSWGTLQYVESDIMLNAMEGLMALGIPSYPVHDSLIVPRQRKQQCVDMLSECFQELTGIIPILK